MGTDRELRSEVRLKYRAGHIQGHFNVCHENSALLQYRGPRP